MSDYATAVGAAITAAGLQITDFRMGGTGPTTSQDHLWTVDGGPYGNVHLVWHPHWGWLVSWGASGQPHSSHWQHQLTPDSDPGAVVDEIRKVLGLYGGGAR